LFVGTSSGGGLGADGWTELVAVPKGGNMSKTSYAIGNEGTKVLRSERWMGFRKKKKQKRTSDIARKASVLNKQPLTLIKRKVLFALL
jgi:hypothetical protein